MSVACTEDMSTLCIKEGEEIIIQTDSIPLSGLILRTPPRFNIACTIETNMITVKKGPFHWHTNSSNGRIKVGFRSSVDARGKVEYHLSFDLSD